MFIYKYIQTPLCTIDARDGHPRIKHGYISHSITTRRFHSRECDEPRTLLQFRTKRLNILLPRGTLSSYQNVVVTGGAVFCALPCYIWAVGRDHPNKKAIHGGGGEVLLYYSRVIRKDTGDAMRRSIRSEYVGERNGRNRTGEFDVLPLSARSPTRSLITGWVSDSPRNTTP